MRSIGIDLHKRSMTACVIDKRTGETFTRSFRCQDENRILEFFSRLAPFEAVIEASATYEWLWLLLEPVAERLVLAHPKKLRIIAESKKKTDRSDAFILAQLLARDEIPEAYRPTPQEREYQHLMKHRHCLVRDRSSVRTRIRSILAARNVDVPGLFSRPGDDWIPALSLPPAESFRLRELWGQLGEIDKRIVTAEEELERFREAAPESQKRKHEIVRSVPGVGNVVADVVVSTLGDVNRFPSIKKVTSYAGVVPGFRESDRKRKELPITKEGPRILRWALIQAAWRAVRHSPYWRDTFELLAARRGRKKAIVAIARRLLGVIYTLLKKGEKYVTKQEGGGRKLEPAASRT